MENINVIVRWFGICVGFVFVVVVIVVVVIVLVVVVVAASLALRTWRGFFFGTSIVFAASGSVRMELGICL